MEFECDRLLSAAASVCLSSVISPKVSAGFAVFGMVNLAGPEKCYGNKSCIKLMVGVLFGTRRA